MSKTGLFQYWQRSIICGGRGTILRLPSLFHGLGARRVVMLSDSGLKAAGIVDRVSAIFTEDSLPPSPRLAGIFDTIAADATTESINAALRYAREVAADSILAVGGGSVLDTAKLVKYAIHKGATDVESLIKSPTVFVSWPEQGAMGVPHISVATTAGTGAEVTSGAAVLNSATGMKHLFMSPYLESDIAVLDPGVTLGLPKLLTAATGMDALTHAIELIAIPNANDFALAHAMYACQAILEWLPKAVSDGAYVDARAAMLNASAMACNAIVNHPGPAIVHNFSHALGSMYHIHHGEANGVLLPIVLEKLWPYYAPTAAKLARAVGVDGGGSAEAVARRVTQRIYRLSDEIGHPRDFRRHGIRDADAEKIVLGVSNDALSALYPLSRQKILDVARVACAWDEQVPAIH